VLHTLRHYYSRVVDAFAARFGERLWITGGWVRAELSGSNYLGDIDCIIVANPEEIASTYCSGGVGRRVPPKTNAVPSPSGESALSTSYIART
jgi:tRNA nucleotidyltransferase/poly(A) polymerase